ncbi:hypothetical protein [Burkholderia sp. BCC1047]|uniref:hypothetical protein n=1 Tax=Burkholderia sp. BCC1047 TaxID=2676299 RepID=UPI00158B99CF|nr:hypothetical protein [Burkholderia sp. BCC1047]
MTAAQRRPLAAGVEQSVGAARETASRTPPPTGSANDKKGADVAENHQETRPVPHNEKQAEGS